jgi:hypothetical protein
MVGGFERFGHASMGAKSCQPMTQKAALDVLCLACTTLVTDGKIVAGSKLAQNLVEAAEVLGAFRHHPAEGAAPDGYAASS